MSLLATLSSFFNMTCDFLRIPRIFKPPRPLKPSIRKKLHIILRLPRGAIGIKNKLDQRNECPFGLDLHELALHILPLNPHVKTQVCMSVCSPRRVRRTHTDAHPQTSDTQMSKLLHPTDVGCKKLVNVVVSALAVFKLVVIFCRG